MLSDTRIADDRASESRGVNMAAHLTWRRQEVLQCEPLTAAILVCGDRACNQGIAEDYALLCELLEPSFAAVTVHVSLGNRDHRGRFCQMAEWGMYDCSSRILESREVTAIRLFGRTAQRSRHRWAMDESREEGTVRCCESIVTLDV